VLALVAIGFVAVVLPLLTSGASGPPSAELNGRIPARARVGEAVVLELAVDNTGNAQISPVCVAAQFDRPVSVLYGVFQGLDKVGFGDGRLCGGRLTTGETISVRIALSVATRGPTRVTLRPAQGPRAIGAPLAGTLVVD
jgi:hypothetical protein